MSENLKGYKKHIYFAIIVTAIGVSINTTLKDTLGALGTVFIAVGGLFFIIGMSQKRKEEEVNKS